MYKRLQKFSIKKVSVGVLSVCLGLSFVQVNTNIVKANEIYSNCENEILYYNYLAYEELTEEQKLSLIRETPDDILKSDRLFYFVYEPVKKETLILPNTGRNNFSYLPLGLGLLVVAIGISKNKKKATSALLILTLVGTSICLPIESFATKGILSKFNKQVLLNKDIFDNPIVEISGYKYVGYFAINKSEILFNNIIKQEENNFKNYLSIDKGNLPFVILPDLEISKLTETSPVVELPEAELQETSKVPENAPIVELPTSVIEKVPNETPVVELPTALIEKVPNETPVVELPTAMIEKVPNETPVVELPTSVIEKVPNETPVVELPTSVIEKVPNETPVVELPTALIEKVPNETPVVELPTAVIEKVPNETPVVELPTAVIEKVSNETPVVELPTAVIEKVPNETPVVELPTSVIEKVPNETPVVELPTAVIEKVPNKTPVVELPTAVIEKVSNETPVVELPTSELPEISKLPETAPVIELPVADIPEITKNTSTYLDDNGDVRKVIWVKGITPPKALTDFKKETVGSYVDYLAKFEQGNGWYDSNKRLENSDGLNDATQCFSAVATNMLYWWMEQNKEEITKYIQELEKNNKFENVEPNTVRDLRYLFKSEGTQQNSVLYNMFVNYFKDRFSGYQTDLLLDFYINGYKPNSSGAINDDEWVYDFKKDNRAGFFYDVFGTKKLSQRMHSGNITTFSNTIKNALESNKIIGLEHTTASRYANHIITVWGAEYDENDNIKAIYITDSDDKDEYKKTGMKRWLVKDVGGQVKVSSSIYPNIGAKLEYIHTLSLGKEMWKTYLDKIASN